MEITRFLKIMCVIVPAGTLAVAHWFPWKKLLGRKLHRLEAYTIGTTAIVGTVLGAISKSEASNKSREEHMSFLTIATISAGATTMVAWAIDALIGRK